MRLDPRLAWALALGFVAWQLLLRSGSYLDNIHYLSAWSTRNVAVGIVAIVVLIAAHALITLRRGPTLVLLGVQVVCAFGPYLIVGSAWSNAAGIVGAAILLTLPARRSWALFGLVVTADAGIQWILRWDDGVFHFFFRVISNLTMGLMLFAVIGLAQLTQQAVETRRQLAAAEADAERSRACNQLDTAVGTHLSTLIHLIRSNTAVQRADLARIAETGRRATAGVRAATGARRVIAPTGATDHTPDAGVSYRLAAWIAIALTILFSVNILNMVSWSGGAEPWEWVVIVLAATISGGLHAYHSTPRVGGSAPRWWRWTVSAQLVLLIVALPTRWGLNVLSGLATLAVAALIVRSRSPLALLMAALLAVVRVAVYWSEANGANLWGVAVTISILIAVAITFYALWALPAVTQELVASREELTRTMVSAERARFARDVHDLLGFHLSAISLKTELAVRAFGTDPELARRHLADVQRSAEAALTEVRSIGIGTGQVSASAEVAATRSLLASAGVAVEADPMPELPPDVDHLLGIVIRECATNVVRHSNATSCRIACTSDDGLVRATITNDGVASGRTRDVVGRGSGIRNLTARLAAAGGVLIATTSGDSFTITVTLPHSQERRFVADRVA
jgi:two-component system, NarL family, sensor histidine kinase DesK